MMVLAVLAAQTFSPCAGNWCLCRRPLKKICKQVCIYLGWSGVLGGPTRSWTPSAEAQALLAPIRATWRVDPGQSHLVLAGSLKEAWLEVAYSLNCKPVFGDLSAMKLLPRFVLACCIIVLALCWPALHLPRAFLASALGFATKRSARRPNLRSKLPLAATGADVAFSFTNLLVEDTPPGISIHDITPQVRACVAKHFANRRSHQRDGVVNLISRHTTTAVTINEDEALLRKDIANFLMRMAPPDAEYQHNHLELRPASDKDRAAIDRNWMSQGKGTLEEFMAQEPKNAHSHLLAITIGQSETIPVAGGELALGQWQPLDTTFAATDICVGPAPCNRKSESLRANTWRTPAPKGQDGCHSSILYQPGHRSRGGSGPDPKAILEKLSEMTGNEAGSSHAASSPTRSPAPREKRKE
eukprot:s71_g12.t1